MSDDNERESLTKNYLPQPHPTKKRDTKLNNTEMDGNSTELENDLKDNRKKNMLKYGLIGGGIVILVVLAIVLPLTLGGGGGGDDPHPPHPPVPPPMAPNSTNDYSIDQTTLITSPFGFSGQILQKKHQLKLREEPQPEGNFTPKIGLDWTNTIKFGSNNPMSDVLNFTFDMIDFKTARLTLGDGKNERFSIPKESINKPETNKNMRLDMVGFRFEGSQ